jgi:hypothetical protein
MCLTNYLKIISSLVFASKFLNNYPKRRDYALSVN